MELIRYCKNKFAVLSVIATMFLYFFMYSIFRTEVMVVSGPTMDSEHIGYTLQSFTLQTITSIFAFLMGMSVIFTTTAFYKNRFYYNINGVISSRLKLFWADETVFFVIASSAAILIMLYSYFSARFSGYKWIFGQGNRVFTFSVIFIFTRIFFCVTAAYALSHFIRSSSRTIAAGLGLQLFQGVSFFATAFYLSARLDDISSPDSVNAVITGLQAPSMVIIEYACGGYNVMTPVAVLATTSIPFAIIFIVAAVAAGRRIEV